jgi:hypothetical protein
MPLLDHSHPPLSGHRHWEGSTASGPPAIDLMPDWRLGFTIIPCSEDRDRASAVDRMRRMAEVAQGDLTDSHERQLVHTLFVEWDSLHSEL